jgi:YesN/AraC family two-component response regulator
VLVVDDEACAREALAAALAAEYSVHLAGSGAEAIRLLAAHDISVVLLDAVLGDEHGLQLVPALRAMSSAWIVLVTGHSSEELAIEAARVGVDDYLKKPIGLPALRGALERFQVVCREPADVLKTVQEHLEEHAGERVDFARLAGRFQLSEPHLRRLFRRAFGTTPQSYFRDLKLRKAAGLLATTTHAVERIALEMGFASASVFSKRFRRLLGVTPSQYRARARGAPPPDAAGDDADGR